MEEGYILIHILDFSLSLHFCATWIILTVMWRFKEVSLVQLTTHEVHFHPP